MAPSHPTRRAHRRAAPHRLAVGMAVGGTVLLMGGLLTPAPESVARIAREGFADADRTVMAVATGVSPLLFATRLALRAAGRPEVRTGSRPAPRPEPAPRSA